MLGPSVLWIVDPISGSFRGGCLGELPPRRWRCLAAPGGRREKGLGRLPREWATVQELSSSYHVRDTCGCIGVSLCIYVYIYMYPCVYAYVCMHVFRFVYICTLK